MGKSHSFDPDKHIPDLSGKVILVTGGNTGLGQETIRQLSKHNPAHIYLAARSQAKADITIKELNKAIPDGAPITFLQLDLSSFDSVKSAARTLLASSTRLDILINNAGIMASPEGVTKDGYEIQFGTNYLSVALLTKLLLPILNQTAALSSDVRVVFLSSSLESNAPKDSYQLDKVKSTMSHISTWARYGQSKLAAVHYAAALTQHYPGIKFITVNPGSVQTGLGDSFMNTFNPAIAGGFKAVYKLMATTVEKGALNQLWAAVSQDAKSGVFYYPVGVTGKGSKLAGNRKLQEQLWQWTEQELSGHTL